MRFLLKDDWAAVFKRQLYGTPDVGMQDLVVAVDDPDPAAAADEPTSEDSECFRLTTQHSDFS